MGFISSAISAVVDILVSIVESVIQVVEVIIHLIMVILGLVSGTSQTIEYFEVFNFPLYSSLEQTNSLLNVVLSSVLKNVDITKNLLYSLVFSSLKINIREYMDFIDDGHYFEGFPTIESHILVIDYTELGDALATLNGAPCTPENSYLRALSNADWIKYWLQENKEYNVGTNSMGAGSVVVNTPTSTAASTGQTQSTNFTSSITDTAATADSFIVNSTSAITTSATTSTSTYAVNTEFVVEITDEITTSDSVDVDQKWYVNFGDTVYNAISDTYTITVYNTSGTTRILPYTVPTKPLQLHYVSLYYIDSNPTRRYSFVYQVGAGTYTDLDVVENAIAMDGTILEVIPDVPLRLSNANYTSFGATKAQQIEDLLDLAGIDAASSLDAILTDADLEPGDLDHIYVKFGVKLWDTSQTGMNYLFELCQNLFPAQGITQGAYDATPTQDDKPTNTIVVTSEDSKYVFQFNYLTFAFTTLATIDADTGSIENGIYYSNLSKFNSDGLLVYPYYNSSGKGTYNVGYVADTLAQVQDFLDGNGVVNPGSTTTEAANWLQTTTRLSYNNTTPVLQDPDGTTSEIIYLTPDRVYENNGAGVLRAVERASEETTSGQSITYYRITKTGLDAYTMAAPIGALKVIDGASGFFRTVKFNLADKEDIMAPFIYTFIKNLSNKSVSDLFLLGAHASIYVAHYEVIETSPMGFFEALVLLVVIVVIIYFAWQAGKELIAKIVLELAAVTGIVAVTTVLLQILIPVIIKQVIIQIIVQEIITAVAADNETLALIIGLIAAVAAGSHEGGSIDFNAGTFDLGSFSGVGDLSLMDFGKIAVQFFQYFNTVQTVQLEKAENQLRIDTEEFKADSARKDAILNAELEAIEKVREGLYEGGQFAYSELISSGKRGNLNALYPEHLYAIYNGQAESEFVSYEFDVLINLQIDPGGSAFV